MLSAKADPKRSHGVHTTFLAHSKLTRPDVARASTELHGAVTAPRGHSAVGRTEDACVCAPDPHADTGRHVLLRTVPCGGPCVREIRGGSGPPGRPSPNSQRV